MPRMRVSPGPHLACVVFTLAVVATTTGCDRSKSGAEAEAVEGAERASRDAETRSHKEGDTRSRAGRAERRVSESPPQASEEADASEQVEWEACDPEDREIGVLHGGLVEHNEVFHECLEGLPAHRRLWVNMWGLPGGSLGGPRLLSEGSDLFGVEEAERRKRQSIAMVHSLPDRSPDDLEACLNERLGELDLHAEQFEDLHEPVFRPHAFCTPGK